MDINVLISNPDFVSEIFSFPQVSGIYVEMERLRPSKIKELIKSAHKAGKKLYVALPYVWNEEVEKTLNREITAVISASPDGYLIRNLDELGLLKDRNVTGKKILDAGMYTWNKSAMKELHIIGADYFTAPYELNSHELSERGFENTEVVIYGYYPMMISNNCLFLTTGKCQKEKNPYGVFKMKDRMGAEFPVVNRCKFCYNIIYNSVPTWLMDCADVYKASSVRLNFTIESRPQMRTILSKYFGGDATAPKGITRGHFSRGAE